MKIFLSYKFTGEDPKVLKETIGDVCDSLNKAKHDVFCSFWKENFYKKHKFSHRQILEYALKQLDKSDTYLAFIKSENKSEGMLMEAGYAIAKQKKFYLAIKKGVQTVFLREMADKIIEFKSLHDLYKKLSELHEIKNR